jgi:hypothetical protein
MFSVGGGGEKNVFSRRRRGEKKVKEKTRIKQHPFNTAFTHKVAKLHRGT